MSLVSRFFFGLLMLVGFGFIAWGFATIYFLPQPEHVVALEGTSLGAFRDMPNWIVGIMMIGMGIVSLLMASISRMGNSIDGSGPSGGIWRIQSWRERNGQHLRVMH